MERWLNESMHNWMICLQNLYWKLIFLELGALFETHFMVFIKICLNFTLKTMIIDVHMEWKLKIATLFSLNTFYILLFPNLFSWLRPRSSHSQRFSMLICALIIFLTLKYHHRIIERDFSLFLLRWVICIVIYAILIELVQNYLVSKMPTEPTDKTFLLALFFIIFD